MRLASSSSASVSVAVVTNSIDAVSAIMRAMRLRMAWGRAHRSPRGLQRARLADVENVALAIEHAVDAGRVRQRLPEAPDHLGPGRDRAGRGLEVEFDLRAALAGAASSSRSSSRISGGTSFVVLRPIRVM
jgi:hypothetical protein